MGFRLFALVIVAILAFSLMGCVLAGGQNKENSQASPNSPNANSQSGSPNPQDANSQAGSPSPQAGAQPTTNSQSGSPNPQDANSQAADSNSQVEAIMLGFNQYTPQKFFNPQEECVAACKFAQRYNVSLRRGPCLLNPMPQHPDYVCDVAHKPRQAVDDDQNNQCSAFRKGISNRFVEVSIDCEVIDVY